MGDHQCVSTQIQTLGARPGSQIRRPEVLSVGIRSESLTVCWVQINLLSEQEAAAFHPLNADSKGLKHCRSLSLVGSSAHELERF